MLQDVDVVGIDTLMRAVQGLYNLMFHPDRDQVMLAPVLHGRFRCPGRRVVELPIKVIELSQGRERELLGDLLLGPVLGLDIPLFSDLMQTTLAFDLVTLGLATSGHEQGLYDVMSVIGMGCGTRGHLANQVSRCHGCSIGATDSARVLL